MARVMPTSTGRRPSATDPTRGYANHDGPIRPGGDPRGDTIDYGPHRGGFSFDGLTSPRWSDRDPRFDYTPEKLQAEADYYKPFNDRNNAALNSNEAYTSARSSGDMKGMIAAQTAMKQANQRQRFIDQGGQGDTWDNRFSSENDWPRPTSSIGYSHGPGRPDFPTRGTNPSPYGPGNSAPPMRGGGPNAASTGGAEAQGGGMPGGRYGGPGVTSGPGGWGRGGGMPGGYNPGQSKSGGGQSPYDFNQPMLQGPSSLGMGGGGPFGGGMGGGPFGGGMPYDLMARLSMGMGGGNFGYGQRMRDAYGPSNDYVYRGDAYRGGGGNPFGAMGNAIGMNYDRGGYGGGMGGMMRGALNGLGGGYGGGQFDPGNFGMGGGGFGGGMPGGRYGRGGGMSPAGAMPNFGNMGMMLGGYNPFAGVPY